MDILIKDKNFKSIKPLDTFKSSIWTVRYNQHGDFELSLPMDKDIFKYVKKENYLDLRGSDRKMIIEEFKISSEEEEGIQLIVSGRSLESILTRRVVWNHTVLTGSLQDGIQQLLEENIINPSISEREIPNFIFEPSTDPRILSLEIDTQYHGEELYKVISELCDINEVGFKMTLDSANNFIFALFMGEDRSYNQIHNPYVVFSSKYENLKNSSYLESILEHKNVSLVGGEGEGSSKTLAVAGSGAHLSRREMYISGSSSKENLTNQVYLTHLVEEGEESLNEHKELKVFDGSADFTKTFRLGEDFDLGDLIHLQNEYGFEAEARATEIIFTQDDSGYEIYPTFVVRE